MVDLSIVLPTCNRAPLLERALKAIPAATRCTFEILVVDGASTDHTPSVLQAAQARLGDRLRVIREEKREGFVKAANKGFQSATGRHLTWINDDACPLDGAFDLAISQLAVESPNVGLVAMFHRWHHTRNVAYETVFNGRTYRLCHIRGTLYANFALGRRSTFERLGFFDERFFMNGADPDLSLKAWQAGLRVVPACGALIDHDELEDERRLEDSPAASADNEKLFAKWDLPARNPHFNDFNPSRPCTLIGLRTQSPIRQAA